MCSIKELALGFWVCLGYVPAVLSRQRSLCLLLCTDWMAAEWRWNIFLEAHGQLCLVAYIPSPLLEVSGYQILHNVTFLLIIICLSNFSWQIRCKYQNFPALIAFPKVLRSSSGGYQLEYWSPGSLCCSLNILGGVELQSQYLWNGLWLLDSLQKIGPGSYGLRHSQCFAHPAAPPQPSAEDTAHLGIFWVGVLNGSLTGHAVTLECLQLPVLVCHGRASPSRWLIISELFQKLRTCELVHWCSTCVLSQLWRNL